MTEAKKPAARKATTAKKPAATKAPAKATAPKAETKTVALKAKPKATTPVKKELTKGIRVTQIGSGVGRGVKQQATLRGLGLGKMHKSRVLVDTPATRGMVNKIKHLVKMEVVG